jgi:Short C-terminal domain
VASGRPQPSNSTIIGVALLLFGAVLLGVGIHHLVSTGTCSSTGYSANYGPVPHCPKGTGWWILFLIGGIFLVIIGGFVTQSSSAAMIVPAMFMAIGIGSFTVAFDKHVPSSNKTFAIIFGGAFAVAGLIPALIILFSGARRVGRARQVSSPAPAAFGTTGAQSTPSPFGTTSSQPDAIMGAYAAGAPASAPPSPTIAPSLMPSRPATTSRSGEDPLEKIAKLAELRKSGALTEDEFNREKAKLLGEL